MDIMSRIKFVAKNAAYFGASAIVINVIKATMPANLTKFERVLISVGSFALTGLVGNAAAAQIDKDFENVVLLCKTAKEGFDLVWSEADAESTVAPDLHAVKEGDDA